MRCKIPADEAGIIFYGGWGTWKYYIIGWATGNRAVKIQCLNEFKDYCNICYI
jgi:hypothetical protein